MPNIKIGNELLFLKYRAGFQNNNIAKMVRVMQNHCNMKRCNDIMDMPTRRGLYELLEGESEMHCDRLVHRTELNGECLLYPEKFASLGHNPVVFFFALSMFFFTLSYIWSCVLFCGGASSCTSCCSLACLGALFHLLLM